MVAINKAVDETLGLPEVVGIEPAISIDLIWTILDQGGAADRPNLNYEFDKKIKVILK